MKKSVLLISAVFIAVLAIVLASCPADSTHTPKPGDDTVVNLLDLTRFITAPFPNWTPDGKKIETAQYTATIQWQTMSGAPVSGAFAEDTQYKAVITVTAKPRYTLNGLSSNSFTVDGAEAGFNTATGVLTVVYPAIHISVLEDDPSGKRVYFLAPDGDDTAGNGTIDAPWFTFKKVQTVVKPGDTVYLRGGKYIIDNANSDNPPVNVNSAQFAVQFSVSGTAENPITYMAYPKDEERPLFDFSGYTSNWTGSGNATLRTGAIFIGGGSSGGTNVRYIHLYGFDVTGVDDYTGATGSNGHAIYLHNSSYNTFENLRVYGNGATAISTSASNVCSYNLIKNCDAWDNHSVRNPPMDGNCDGFGIHTANGSSFNVVYGCRAWNNADDGYDCINSYGQVIYDHCWAAYNGYFYGNGYSEEYKRTVLDRTNMTRSRDGNGFKNGGWNMGNGAVSATPATAPKMVVRYSLAIGNPNAGLQNNYQLNGGRWFYNTAHNNVCDIRMVSRWNETDIGSYFQINAYDTVMIGNVVIPGGVSAGGVEYLDVDSGIVENNSFILMDNGAIISHGRNSRNTSLYPNPPEYESSHRKLDIVQNPLDLTTNDFISIDENLFLTPRKPDGSLPETDLCRPKPGTITAHIGYTAPDANADGFGDAWKKAGAKPLIQP